MPPRRATLQQKCDYQREYYTRNSEARREYQVRYNRVKRATRRKLSKGDLEALKEKIRHEVNGTIRIFENHICRKSGVLDSEYTADMVDDELHLIEDLQDSRVSESSSYFREHPDADEDGWIPTYTNQMEKRLLKEAEWGRRTAHLHKEGKESREHVHAMRRRVAIIHQEIYLLRQGLEVPTLAVDANASVACGYGVNKTEFRRRYGF
ncbi:hypothetical protein QCA50_013178 [Cerrena zonata]|uniref:Uncharacterized protein n=1 Tax=Cerrena zonata TaxID=2478898 RepID=A0AAW0G2L8_9APHY